MNVKPKKESTTQPEDERSTLPDLNTERDEDTLPHPHNGGVEGDIGAVQRPPADS